MTDLSPAAQAVLDAFLGDARDTGLEIDDLRENVASALRAVAHEVAPFPGRYPMNEYMEGFRDAKQSVHLQLIAIADELDPPNS